MVLMRPALQAEDGAAAVPGRQVAEVRSGQGAHALSTSGPHCECCTCRRVRFGANRDGKRTSGPCGLPGNAAGQR